MTFISNVLKFSITSTRYLFRNQQRNISFINAQLRCNTKQDDADTLLVKPRVQPIKDIHEQEIHRPPDCPEDSRFLKVAIIGVPNSGKSTLTNQLVTAPVCDVSNKVHTTLHTTSAILVRNNVQVVFLDTPGMVTLRSAKKHNLAPSIVSDPLRSLKNADLFMVVVDMEAPSQRFELPYIIGNTLKNYSKDKQTILVLNKVDLVKNKRNLLYTSQNLTTGKVDGQVHHTNRKSLTRRAPETVEEFLVKKKNYGQLMKVQDDFEEEEKEVLKNSKEEHITSWPHFSRIFMVSALNNDGINDLREYLMSQAIPASWAHHSSVLTTTPPQTLAKMVVRSRILHHLYRNIPYSLKYKVIDWRFTPDNILTISMEIICPRDSVIKIVVGHNGERIQRIAQEASTVLNNLFGYPVDMYLLVK